MADANENGQQTQTEGSIKAGYGSYFFDLAGLDSREIAEGLSTGRGQMIEGDRMQVGLVHKPAGSGSRLHTHSNEQFNYVVEGVLRVKIGDEDEYHAGPGELVYIPPETEHYSMAGKDEDCVFFVCKDMSDKAYGRAVDEDAEGPQYDPGFEPDDGA